MQLIPAQLASNAVLIALILLYAIIDILAWSRNGIFVQELKALKDTSNERTFSEGEKRFSRLNPFIFMQYYLFFGLSLLTVIFPDAGQMLQTLPTISADIALKLAFCIGLPLFWYLLQRFMHVWINFIFGGHPHLIILVRIYKSTHLLAGLFTWALFTAVVTWQLSSTTTAILLIGIFIITQLVFIFSGIKIFLRDFGSLCLIIVYLCALEIAPLAVIAIKMGLGK